MAENQLMNKHVNRQSSVKTFKTFEVNNLFVIQKNKNETVITFTLENKTKYIFLKQLKSKQEKKEKGQRDKKLD